MYTTVLLCTLVKKEQAIVKPIKRPKNTAKFYLKFRGQYKNTWAIKKVKKSLVNTPNWLKEIAWNLLLDSVSFLKKTSEHTPIPNTRLILLPTIRYCNIYETFSSSIKEARPNLFPVQIYRLTRTCRLIYMYVYYTFFRSYSFIYCGVRACCTLSIMDLKISHFYILQWNT